MYQNVEKPKANKNEALANSISNKKTDGEEGISLVDNRPANNAQRKTQSLAYDSVSQPVQKKENNTGLPDNLKSGIENLSGYSMDDVTVHYNSDKPAQLQAHAYAQGTDIHLGSGQERHLPHEAWHVVQQKQGRVKPTMQMKGKINVNDDTGLEKEADAMGTLALSSSSGHTLGLSSIQNSDKVVQRAIGMEFETKIPVYNEDTAKKMSQLWNQLLEAQDADKADILAKMDTVPFKPGPNITSFPEFGLRMDVDAYRRGLNTYNDSLSPPLLLGANAILELVSEPIETEAEFNKMEYLFKDFMRLFSEAWKTPFNRDVDGFVFGPADDNVYPGLYNNKALPVKDLKSRRDDVYNKYDNSGSLQVNFSFDPRRIYEVFKENRDVGMGLPEASTIDELKKDPYWKPVTDPSSERVSRNKNWQEDISKATGASQLLTLRIKKNESKPGKELPLESLAGIRSVFLFWAYNLVIGNRSEPPLGMPKNIPAFLMKTSFSHLCKAALTQEEFSFLDRNKAELLGDLINILKIGKGLGDSLFNSNPAKKISDLLGNEQIPAGSNSTVRDMSVRPIDPKEQHLLPDEAKTADKKGKSGIVFESRYILVTNVDNISSIFGKYQKWVEKHSQEHWKDT